MTASNPVPSSEAIVRLFGLSRVHFRVLEPSGNCESQVNKRDYKLTWAPLARKTIFWKVETHIWRVNTYNFSGSGAHGMSPWSVSGWRAGHSSDARSRPPPMPLQVDQSRCALVEMAPNEAMLPWKPVPQRTPEMWDTGAFGMSSSNHRKTYFNT